MTADGSSTPAPGRPVLGAYVAGWIKRGPTGFIGTNKSCSFQTVQALVADFNAGELTDPVAGPAALARLVAARQPHVVDSAGWRAIDAAEVARGSDDGRPRNKFTDIADMLAAAAPRRRSRHGDDACWPGCATRGLERRPLGLRGHRLLDLLHADLANRLAQ